MTLAVQFGSSSSSKMGTTISWRRGRLKLIFCVCLLLLALFIFLNHLYQNDPSKFKFAFFKREGEPYFRKKNNLNCPALLNGTKLTDLTTYEERKPMAEYKFWESIRDCDEIRRRYFYPKHPLSRVEAEFPLAYVIFVDSNLEQLEMFFNAIYQPQNFYCFHIDFRAHFMVHDFLNRFVRCFDPNHVFIADQSVPIAQTSASVLYAHRACLLKLMMSKSKMDSAGDSNLWKYALTVDGRDFPLRTNREIVEILKLHDGGNDVELVEPLTYRYTNTHKLVTDHFGQAVDMEETTHANLPPPLEHLKIYKGNMATALSRPFVDFLLHHATSIKILTWLAKTYMPSELFLSTLIHNQEFSNLTGGYPGECLRKDSTKRKSWISRFTLWSTYETLRCNGRWDRGHCTFGLFDLPTLNRRSELFAHNFDFRVSTGVVECLHERLHNRTYEAEDPLRWYRENDGFYRRLSAVQYEKWRKKMGMESQMFKCVMCETDCDH